MPSAVSAGGGVVPWAGSNPHRSGSRPDASACWATTACPWTDSNRRPLDPESSASTGWATRASWDGRESNSQAEAAGLRPAGHTTCPTVPRVALDRDGSEQLDACRSRVPGKGQSAIDAAGGHEETVEVPDPPAQRDFLPAKRADSRVSPLGWPTMPRVELQLAPQPGAKLVPSGTITRPGCKLPWHCGANGAAAGSITAGSSPARSPGDRRSRAPAVAWQLVSRPEVSKPRWGGRR